jgi:phenylpropionate dioxygenase-like ring-hydroxylating dioxygenase large terminal subunit
MPYDPALLPAQPPAAAKSYQDYLDADPNPVPAHFRQQGDADLAGTEVSVAQYTDRAWYERERAMWDRVWQVACREEHIPQVGDYEVYEICNRSYLVVRVAPDVITAYPNACLHRGRRLRSECGSAEQLRCPFHGFTWNLDGSCAHIPSAKEFAPLTAADFALPELQVATWCGWVLINPDPQAPPLASYLAPIDAHYAPYLWAQSFVGIHVGKVLQGNWKVIQEAFMESFHAADTHPQIMPQVDDVGCQYDQWEGQPHVSRMMTPFVAASGFLTGLVNEQEIYDSWTDQAALPIGAARYTLQPGETARNAVARQTRAALEPAIGVSLAHVSDAELIDGWYYNVFPNLMFWGGYGPNMFYRFRPNGDDHENTLMEVGFIMRHRPDEPKPAPAKYRLLGADEAWSAVPELGGLGHVLDQDTTNMAEVQRGLKATFSKTVPLAAYQESRIRHFHQTLGRYVG